MDRKEFIEVGQRIAECRKRCGLTLDDVGHALGMHRSSVQRYECGQTRTIKLVILERLAQILGTTPEYLLTGYTAGQEPGSTGSKPRSYAPAMQIKSDSTIDFDAIIRKAIPSKNNNMASLRAPFDYIQGLPNNILTDDQIVESDREGILPLMFGYVLHSDDLAPRAVAGDLLLIRTTDRPENGSLCMLRVDIGSIIFRRIFYSDFGIALATESTNTRIETFPYIGRDSGIDLIGRVTQLTATL